jgi:hypothetical protein
MSRSKFRLRTIISPIVIFSVVFLGLAAPASARMESTSSPELWLTQLREPPPNCGDSFQVTSAK